MQHENKSYIRHGEFDGIIDRIDVSLRASFSRDIGAGEARGVQEAIPEAFDGEAVKT